MTLGYLFTITWHNMHDWNTVFSIKCAVITPKTKAKSNCCTLSQQSKGAALSPE